MKSTPAKLGQAGRSRNAPSRQEKGNKGNGRHTAGTQIDNRLDIYAKIGGDVERVYRNIDRGCLKTH